MSFAFKEEKNVKNATKKNFHKEKNFIFVVLVAAKKTVLSWVISEIEGSIGQRYKRTVYFL